VAAGGANGGGGQWEPVEGDTGRYFYNRTTGESRWEAPSASDGALVPVPVASSSSSSSSADGEWIPWDDGQGNTYYYNSRTGATQWEHPGAMVPAGGGLQQQRRSRGEGGGAASLTAALGTMTDPDGDEWTPCDDGQGNTYYLNTRTGTTQWEDPTGAQGQVTYPSHALPPYCSPFG
jgi:outer membrane protein assembly factor BamB